MSAQVRPQPVHDDATEGLGPMLPAVVCKACRAWWPWTVYTPLPATCEHEWPVKYATGDGGRRQARARGFTEGGAPQGRLFA